MKQSGSMKRSAPLLLAVCCVACGGEGTSPGDAPTSETVVIAPLTRLSEVDATEDPLDSHRPEIVDCNNLSGWYVEDGLLEANTAECDYLALVEGAAAPAYAGETLEFELSHFDLTAPEAAEAHIAILVEADIIWESTIPIPSDAQALEISVELERDIQEGDLIGIHLHNHGQNTWNLSPFTVQRER